MEMVEKAVAKSLMDIKAVMLRPDEPFVWASGWHSPIYCDNRRILSYPEIREKVCGWMADIIRKQYPDVEVIAGVATGAIAHGYLVAHLLGKPFCYVRPKPKDHGTGSQIEGILEKGAKVVIVEDLIDTGTTLSHLCELLRTRDPASLEICTLMDKPERRLSEVPVKYSGFSIPDEFVIGYGLDYAERYRNLPEVYILSRKVYEK